MTAAPKWFKPVGVVALIWNLIGLSAFVVDLRMTPDDIAKLSMAQQALYATHPLWSIVASGTAVFGGVLGSLGLVLGKRWAHLLLVLSLVGVIFQDIWLFGRSGSMAASGTTVVMLQSLVLIIALGLVLLASRARRYGWIS